MSRAEKVKTRLVSATLAGLLVAVCLSTENGAQIRRADTQSEQPAEQVYKNIDALKGLRASELDGVMEFMSASLGVGCTFCHTNPWDSDAKPAKLTTRRMIRMTQALNREHFSGNPVVNCYTCHRGAPQTVTIPAVDLATLEPSVLPAPKPVVESLPAIEQVIDRYIAEIGGQPAIDKIKTRVSRGDEITSNRMTPPVTVRLELFQTAENKLLAVRESSTGTLSEGFNGSIGWSRDVRGQRRMPDKRLAEIRREADFFRYLKIRQTYPQMRVLARERVGDRDCIVVGATSRDEVREKLYFDAQTGLLIRTYLAFKTAFGTIPEITDFGDYREVDGVKFPFTIKWSRQPFSSIRKFIEIKLDMAVDETKFERPAG